MGGPGYSITAETLMQTQEQTAVSTVLHPAKVWERFVDGVYSILKRTHLENVFHHIRIFIKTLRSLWRKKVMENYRFFTLYWNVIIEKSLYRYIGSLHILTNNCTAALTRTQVANVLKRVVSSLLNRAYSIITNKDVLTKENARIK